MHKSLRFLAPLIIFLILTGFLLVGLHRDPREVPSPLIGKPAPDFSLTRLEQPAQILRRGALLGQVWTLNVWASWCVACREEHATLLEFSRRGLVPVYGLDYKDERVPGVRWLMNFGNPYAATLFDPDGRAGIDWGVYGVPETFVIDKSGTIRYKHIGPLTPEVIHDELEPLLKQLNA